MQTTATNPNAMCYHKIKLTYMIIDQLTATRPSHTAHLKKKTYCDIITTLDLNLNFKPKLLR
jgi:hypothetical protein